MSPHSASLRLASHVARRVRPRELKVDVAVVHEGPAYLDEEFSIHIDVVNQDNVAVEVFLDILLQPGEDDSRASLLSSLVSDTDSQLQQTNSSSTTSPPPPSSKPSPSASSLPPPLSAAPSASSASAPRATASSTSPSALNPPQTPARPPSPPQPRRCARSVSRLCSRCSRRSIRGFIGDGRRCRSCSTWRSRQIGRAHV